MAYYNDNLTTYQTSIGSSLVDLYNRIIQYLPNVIVAVIVVILGWLVGSFLSNVLQRLLNAINIDSAADRLGLAHLSQRVGKHISIARIVHWIVKWFFILGSFIAAADILGLHEQVTVFFYEGVLGYAGHVVVAMAILLLGMLAANFFADLVESALKASQFHAASGLSAITRWSIVIFTFIAVLSELQIAQAFLQDLFRAVIALLAVAGGIAFGLGGKDHAKKVLDNVESSLTRKM